MPKLNQIIAILSGRKTAIKDLLTKLYQQIQKPDLLTGLSRTYTPKDELGEQLPPEKKLVPFKIDAALRSLTAELADFYDLVIKQDASNGEAKADILVDGLTIVKDVPVTTLLFLEKQLVDLHTLIEKLPVLDTSDSWVYNPDLQCYESAAVQSLRSKKTPRVITKAEATQHHPAQVEVMHEDVPVGTWTSVKYSGAIPLALRNEKLTRVRKLTEAVKQAREQANGIEASKLQMGKEIIKYIFEA